MKVGADSIRDNGFVRAVTAENSSHGTFMATHPPEYRKMSIAARWPDNGLTVKLGLKLRRKCVFSFCVSLAYSVHIGEKVMKKVLIAWFATLLFAFAGLAAAAVDINSATATELEAVKGIGKSKAKAIIDYREKNGPFKSVDDLKNIKGFKAKTIEKLRPELTVGGESTSTPAPAAVAAPKPAPAPVPAAPAPVAPIKQLR